MNCEQLLTEVQREMQHLLRLVVSDLAKHNKIKGKIEMGKNMENSIKQKEKNGHYCIAYIQDMTTRLVYNVGHVIYN